jgi:transcriptional regulator with XRE-family HTH domain
MKKNEALSKFLKDKRNKLKKTQAQVAETLGVKQPNYYYWESSGKLPRDFEKREKLAEIMGLTIDELLEKAGVATEDQQNLILLIKAIAQTNCETIYFEDIEFLNETQVALDQQMSPVLIEELMKHRIGQTNGQFPAPDKPEVE